MKKLVVIPLILVALAAASAATGASTAPAAVGGAKCGGGLTASLTPVLQGSYDFTLVCIQHDQCYAKFGISKGSCDSAFIGNMLAECAHMYPVENNAQKRLNGVRRHSCEHVAGQYHVAVVSRGRTAYEKAQTQAVQALFNGTYNGVGSVTLTATDSDGTSFSNTQSLGSPVMQVAGGAVSGGSALAITADTTSGTATATATESIPTGFGVVTINLTFNYSLNGPATVKGTVDTTQDDGMGGTLHWTGTLGGTKPFGT
jgi:hypothetical protein